MMANFDDLFTTPAAPEPPSAPPQLTKEEYAAKKKAERDDLYALADEMAHEIMQDGDAFRGFLDVQARFDRYSATNALLIYAQNDKATRLRDFDGWKKQGVYVRRHETGISILEAGDSYVTEDGRTGYYYHVKKVFDIAQTDAKRQPQIHYDDRLLLSALISKRPVPIEMAENVPNGAAYDYTRRTVVVQRGMDGQDLFRCVSLAMARAELDQTEHADPQADAFRGYCIHPTSSAATQRRCGGSGSALRRYPGRKAPNMWAGTFRAAMPRQTRRTTVCGCILTKSPRRSSAAS